MIRHDKQKNVWKLVKPGRGGIVVQDWEGGRLVVGEGKEANEATNVEQVDEKITTRSLSQLYTYDDNVLNIMGYNGLVANLVDHDGTPSVRVSAFHAIRGVEGGQGPVIYGIRKAGVGAGFPAVNDANQGFNVDSKKAWVEFECAEIGIQSIDVWVKDNVNTTGTFFNTYIIIEDNDGLCEEE